MGGDGDQRGLVEVRVGDPGDEVGGAGAESRKTDTGLPGEPAPDVGDKGRPLLVAGRHELNGRVVQGEEEIFVLLPRHTEDVPDPFVLQTLDKKIRDFHGDILSFSFALPLFGATAVQRIVDAELADVMVIAAGQSTGYARGLPG